jgi:N-acetylmuramoyl-L-alanine amidase
MTRRSYITVILALSIAVIPVYMVHRVSVVSASNLSIDQAFILIDAGHGGKDGGTSTNNGVLEDDINLAISLPLRDMLKLCGYTVRMTRDSDTMVTGDQDDVNESSKVNDMHNRLALYDAALLTVSIHQNHFSQSQYNGAQVFYSVNRPESRDIASLIQQQVIGFLQPENHRTIKPAGENIFLLHKTKQPAVIVECGFLSNEKEAKLLQQKEYQQKMAFSICCGLLKYVP